MPTYGAAAQKVDVTSAERVLFPGDDLTKGDLVEYYASVAEFILPHINDRALTLQRSPEGLSGNAFFQQNTPDHYPEWIDRITLERVEGGQVSHPVANSVSALVYMANQGCITFHSWLSRTDMPRRPDRMIFDLDPSDDDFEKVREAAFELQATLVEIDLVPYVKTTGSRGVHVVVPLRRNEEFDGVREFAGAVAGFLAGKKPNLLTIEQRKAKRGDRVFVDTLRNSYGQTAVAPYSVRLKAGAPVSTPITWEQLRDRKVGPRSFTIQNILFRLGQTGDTWSGMGKHARGLSNPRAKLDKLRER